MNKEIATSMSSRDIISSPLRATQRECVCPNGHAGITVTLLFHLKDDVLVAHTRTSHRLCAPHVITNLSGVRIALEI